MGYSTKSWGVTGVTYYFETTLPAFQKLGGVHDRVPWHAIGHRFQIAKDVATGEASAVRAPSFQELPAWTAADAVRQALRSPGGAPVTGREVWKVG